MEKQLTPTDSMNRRIGFPLALLFVFVMMMMISASANAADSLLVVRVQGSDFELVLKGLTDELADDFDIHDMVVNKNTSASDVRQKMDRHAPKVVVLMDNVAIYLFKKYQSMLRDTEPVVPSICLMASFIDLAVKGLKNTTGIFYEVPIVTSVVSLRAVLTDLSFRRIGVVHRHFMDDLIRTNQTYCRREDIKLVSRPIPDKSNMEAALKSGLRRLQKNEKVDAIWVPNDNMMLNAALLRSVWIPFAEQFKKPILVGVEVLVQPRFKFGTFAVTPDPIQLGYQAAEIIFDIKDNDWQFDNRAIAPPRSVRKTANLEQMKRLFGTGKEGLMNVDRILE